ncbi:MAG: hypothetical protein AAGU73_02475 [Actinomycetota bacterium]
MNGNRPDVTDEDIGMRAFQMRKAQAVERATERIRQGLQADWGMFTQRDLADLDWLLGELWAYEKRADWNDLHFSKLTADDIKSMIEDSREIRQEGSHNTVETLTRVGALIRSRSV